MEKIIQNFRFKVSVLLSSLFLIYSLSACAQDPWMIKDVNPTNSVSSVYVNILNNGTVIGTNGCNSGYDFSITPNLYAVNGTVLFLGTDGANIGIFKTDGTTAGTTFVSALPLTANTPLTFNTGDKLYVQLDSGLYSTDGTAGGTYMIYNNQTQGAQYGTVSNINQNTQCCYYKGNLYFIAGDTNVFESNGTATGTSFLLQIPPPTTGQSVGSGEIAVFNNSLYYLFSPGYYLAANSDLYLYSYSLSTKQTVVASDLSVAGNDSTSVAEMVNLNDKYLLINGNFGGVGQVLSLSTTSASPTVILKDPLGATLLYGSAGGVGNLPVIYNSSLFIQIVSGLNSSGAATYRTAVTNGTSAGTFTLGFDDSNFWNGYVGMSSSGMVFYDDSNLDTAKIYRWNGAASNSYKLLTVASDSLTSTGNAIGMSASQIGANFVFTVVANGYPSIFLADTAGTYCYNMSNLNVSGSGAVLNNNYLFLGQAAVGLSAGIEPHIFSPNSWNIWTGNTSTDWNTKSNWLNGSVPTAASNVIIPTVAKFPVVNSSAVCANLVITNENYNNSPVPNVTITAPGNLSINAGYLWNSGYITGTGSLNITGLGTGQVSTYDCSKIYSYTNPHSALEVDTINIKGADLDLTNVNFVSPTSGTSPLGSLNINSVINFQSNNKLIANFNSLYFDKSFEGYNAQRYILTNRNTFVNFTGYNFPLASDTVATLPIGTTRTSYTPVTVTSQLLNNNNNSANSFQVSITDTVVNAGTSNTNYVKKTWNVETTGIFPNYMILGWEAGDQLTGFNANNCYVSAYTGSNWPSSQPQAAKSDSGLFTARELYGKDLNASYAVFSTPIVIPTTQASAVDASSITPKTATLNWTNGNGAFQAVFMAPATTGSPAPVDSTDYTASAKFGSGSQIGSSGWFCVYNGSGSTVNVGGLSPNTGYRVMVLEYNGASGVENYLTTTATSNPINFKTLPASTNDLLSSLLYNGLVFQSPVFNPDSTNYVEIVQNGTASVTVTPTLQDTTATLTVNGVAAVSGMATAAIPISVGDNNISIVVTAQDGKTTKTYTLDVQRLGSSNVNLSNLTTSSGTLSPVFSPTTTSYTDAVPNNVTSIQVTPTLSDITASVTVNNVQVQSGSASAAIPLSVGSNEIIITVYSFGYLYSNTDTITVIRSLSSNASLSSLAMSTGSLSPAFVSGTLSYTASLPTSDSTISITPTVSDLTATVTVNGVAVKSGVASAPITLNPGSNAITVIVTAQNGSTQTYTVNVTRALPTIFTLPDTNFKLTITGATCDGSANGSVAIKAAQSLNYTATVSGSGVSTPYSFTDSLTIGSLAAGSYNVCLTVAGQPQYQQCYDVMISQPQDLSVYAAVNSTNNSLDLNLSGGNTYSIKLNGVNYTTTNSTYSLPLQAGQNNLEVTTDRLCQGTFIRSFNILSAIVPFPDPFQSTLSVNLGTATLNNATVQVYNLSYSKLFYSKQYGTMSGTVLFDLSALTKGVYALKITSGNTENIFKIIKQ